MTSFNLHYFVKGPVSYTVMLKVRAAVYDIEGDTVQSIAYLEFRIYIWRQESREREIK